MPLEPKVSPPLSDSPENPFPRPARSKWQRYAVLYLFCIVIAVGGYYMMWRLAQPFWYSSLAGTARLVLIMPVAGLSAYLIVRHFRSLDWRRDHGAFRQFAAAHSFSYAPGGPCQGEEKGIIFQQGRNRCAYDIVSGQYAGRPFRLFKYRYTIGKEKTGFAYTVCDLEFNASFPRMLLDAYVVGYSEFKNELIRLPLEAAEFDKVFTLYITPGSQLIALQIFTPDLMAELIDLPRKYDMEFIGNQLYLFATGEIRSVKELEAMYVVIEHIVKNVGLVAERMKL